MNHEIDIYGVFVPDLFAWIVVTFILAVPLRRVLGRIGVYRYVWHRMLFDVALFVILLGCVVAAAQGFAAS